MGEYEDVAAIGVAPAPLPPPLAVPAAAAGAAAAVAEAAPLETPASAEDPAGEGGNEVCPPGPGRRSSWVSCSCSCSSWPSSESSPVVGSTECPMIEGALFRNEALLSPVCRKDATYLARASDAADAAV